MKSEILQRDYEHLIKLHKRMTPEERLVAFLNHSYLIGQIYQAGLTYRMKEKGYRKLNKIFENGRRRKEND